MKLITKTTLYPFYFTIIAFVAGGFISYYSIRSIIYRQIDESLITEKNIIQEQIEYTDTIPNFETAFGHLIEVKIYDHLVKKKQIIKDSLIITEPKDVEDIPYRSILYSNNTKNKKGYTIQILQPVSETHDLLEDISMLLFILFISLVLIFVAVNYWISKRIWIPFYNALDIISKFDISSTKPLKFSKTDINEFVKLNKVLENMSEKIRTDYINLKEFNENASHELQTPLSIIRSKLELLTQFENLSSEQINILQSVNEAVTRLSGLNKGLLLISKIDNQQFKNETPINLNNLVDKFLKDFEEIIELKGISISKVYESSIVYSMDPLLAEVLLTNLISNAIRHNINQGKISITTQNRTLIVSNTGSHLSVDPSSLFNRFVKGNDTNSVGLGLSIVKKIATYYKFDVSYTYTNNIHELRIDF